MGELILVSGFLGAGKTTLLRRILAENRGRRMALLENEFGTCSVDDLLLQGGGVPVRTLASGCVCCSLALEFTRAVAELTAEFQPELLLVEPSGVAGLSDLLRSCAPLPSGLDRVRAITVVDAQMHPVYAEEMGDFYWDQIRSCGALVCSKLDLVTPEEGEALAAQLARENPGAAVFCCPWEHLDMPTLLDAPPQPELDEHHHHHHHAGAVFTSLALHPAQARTAEEWEGRLAALGDKSCGQVLRAKGILPAAGGGMVQVDYTPVQVWIRPWPDGGESILTVIGTRLEQEAIAQQLG